MPERQPAVMEDSSSSRNFSDADKAGKFPAGWPPPPRRISGADYRVIARRSKKLRMRRNFFKVIARRRCSGAAVCIESRVKVSRDYSDNVADYAVIYPRALSRECAPKPVIYNWFLFMRRA